jgi:CRISPR-associated endonuclease/helicase Cas3
VQEEVERRVKTAFIAKNTAGQLLDIAKRAVEIAIEKNEKAAMRFLEKHAKSDCAMINTSSEAENEKDKITKRPGRAMENKAHAGRAKKALPGKHPEAGARLHGLRRRARKSQDAERVSEESEEYSSTTRFVESSLGIKSYSELAPYLAQGIERVMASLLNKNAAELLITPEFICSLHRDAFKALSPGWAGKYRARNITMGKHTPPPYYEVPLMVRQYCEDLEARLSALGAAPAVSNILLETLAFAEGRFLSIHPFLDLNGRVARMLLFALCYRLELPPLELVPAEQEEKKIYFYALSEGDKLNWEPLIEIWRQRLKV